MFKNAINRFASSLISNDTLLDRRSLSNFLNGNEDRDIYQECGYPISIEVQSYTDMYHREGIARRVVKILPDESWSVDPVIYEDKNRIKTEFEKKWEYLLFKNKVLHYLQRIDALSGIGRYGLLLLGIDDGRPLSSPIKGIDFKTGESTTKNDYKLLYLKVFDESVVTVSMTEMDVHSPRYGFPTLYNVKFETTDETYGSTEKVHWTRVIHIADNRESSEVYGSPRMKPVYNRLLDIQKILGGSGEMFWKGGFPGLSIETQPDLAAATMDTDAIKDQMEKYMNGMQRYLATQGITVKSLNAQVASPKEHIEANVNNIAMTLQVPVRIFLGSEEGKLASSQDKYTWNTRVSQRQKRYVSPYIIQPFIDKLMQLGILPEIDIYSIEWPDLNIFTDRERADVAKTMTEAMSRYVTDGVESIMPLEQYLELITHFSQEEITAIMKAMDKRDELITADLDLYGKTGHSSVKPPEETQPLKDTKID